MNDLRLFYGNTSSRIYAKNPVGLANYLITIINLLLFFSSIYSYVNPFFLTISFLIFYYYLVNLVYLNYTGLTYNYYGSGSGIYSYCLN